MCEALVSQPYKMDVVVCACNPSTGDLKVEDEKSKVILRIQNKFDAILGYMRCYLKNKHTNKQPPIRKISLCLSVWLYFLLLCYCQGWNN